MQTTAPRMAVQFRTVTCLLSFSHSHFFSCSSVLFSTRNSGFIAPMSDDAGASLQQSRKWDKVLKSEKCITR
jgi:hypothetical protein